MVGNRLCSKEKKVDSQFLNSNSERQRAVEWHFLYDQKKKNSPRTLEMQLKCTSRVRGNKNIFKQRLVTRQISLMNILKHVHKQTEEK